MTCLGFSRNFLHSLAGKLSFFSTYNSKLPTLQGLFVTYAVRCFSCREKCTCTSEKLLITYQFNRENQT